ncbi:MAG: DUF294 nucleotidyltransferase-like domain-containing protein [Marinobacter sp.]|nr:DUF294 nucleotidyltransferase-like domain-containing protein [Marinobacter sp.]
MEVELIEIRDHMRQFAPFDELPEDALNDIAGHVEIAYFRAGSQILAFGEPIQDLYYVRSGAVEIYRRTGELYNRLEEGGIFGQFGLLQDKSVRFPAKAIEDTLIYCLPEPLFRKLWSNHESFADFVEVEDRSRLRAAMTQAQGDNRMMTAKVRTLITRPPVTAPSIVSIREAAELMTEQGVSSLVLTDPAEDGGLRGENRQRPDYSIVQGIITDRDLRTRVLATGLSPDTPVHEIMSAELFVCEADDFIFEAMLTMLRHNVHHLPVLHKHKPVGVIGLSDIIRHESQSSLFLVSNIHRKHDVRSLKALSADVKATFVRMVNEDANSHMVGSAMAGIGRSFTQRLLELGEEQLGPPPVPYCFLALGSMARDEQLIVTDQDNAMILDDRFDPQAHDAYFLALAKFVSDGLAACGYTYCTGDIMATNTRWRQPLSVWKGYFTDWIEKPRAEALLHSNIFFDLDGIYGETSLTTSLKELIASKASKNARFLAHMARNALNRTPPLGFFRTFVLEEDGQHRKTINLKRRGTAPLSDLIRVHALAVGSRAANSFERLNDVAATQLLPDGVANNLKDALEFISIVRIRHQAQAIEAGKEPSNNIDPEQLSAFERRNLKDAFQILSNAQKFLRHRYGTAAVRPIHNP